MEGEVRCARRGLLDAEDVDPGEALCPFPPPTPNDAAKLNMLLFSRDASRFRRGKYTRCMYSSSDSLKRRELLRSALRSRQKVGLSSGTGTTSLTPIAPTPLLGGGICAGRTTTAGGLIALPPGEVRLMLCEAPGGDGGGGGGGMTGVCDGDGGGGG